jgi:hypothetical protein
MPTFPQLQPSSRTFTPGQYPHVRFRGMSGRQNAVRTNNVMLESRLRLSFLAITEAEMLSILSHYSQQRGSFESFPIPADVLSGVGSTADFSRPGYGWIYAGPPSVEDLMCGGHDVTLELISVPPEGTALLGMNAIVRALLTPGGILAAGGGALSVDVTFTPGEVSTVSGLNLSVGVSLAPGNTSGTESDPLFSNVVLLMHCEGTNNSTTFTDSSSKNLTLTPYNGAKITTTSPLTGQSSGLLSSISGESYEMQYVETQSSSSLVLAADFAIELKLALLSNQPGGYRTLFELDVYNTGLLVRDEGIYVNGSRIWDTIEIVAQSPTYFMIQRLNGVMSYYFDGVKQKTDSGQITATLNAGGNPLRIGASRHYGGQYLNMRFDEVRVTVGAARTTGNYTPSSDPFPDS